MAKFPILEGMSAFGEDIMNPAVFVYDENYANYQFHADHPFNPQRLVATCHLIETLGWLKPEQCLKPLQASTELLQLAHSPYYIDLVQRLSESGRKTFGIERLGLGTDDNPVFQGMHEAASLAVGGTLTAAQAVVSGNTKRAVNLAGGLHHAGFGHASGFCIYNDVVVAIRWLRRETGWRVLYVETDAHHGDGVQDAFYEDPAVFFLSLHESGRFLFPGSGNLEETGTGAGAGTTLNVPLMPTTDDDSWLEAFLRVVPVVMEAFQPDIVISQHGCDGHYWDPLADLCATTRFYSAVPQLLSKWVDHYSPGRWIAVGGGGYQALRVVPRAWSLLWAHVTGRAVPVDTRIPREWLAHWQGGSPSRLPDQLLDQPDQFPPIKDSHRVLKANREALLQLGDRFPQFNFPPTPFGESLNGGV